MSQLIPRTLRRALKREELWNGNTERLTNLTSLDPETSVIAWSWTHHAEYRARYQREATLPEWTHLRFWFTHSRADVERVVHELTSAAP